MSDLASYNSSQSLQAIGIRDGSTQMSHPSHSLKMSEPESRSGNPMEAYRHFYESFDAAEKAKREGEMPSEGQVRKV